MIPVYIKDAVLIKLIQLICAECVFPVPVNVANMGIKFIISLSRH